MENGFQLDFAEIKICYCPHLPDKKCQRTQLPKSNSLGTTKLQSLNILSKSQYTLVGMRAR